MTRLSDHPQEPMAQFDKFIPFTVFARIVPTTRFNKRFETVRDRERLANEVEDCLRAIDDSSAIEVDDYDIAFPVASTPQFGDFTARVTIHGNWKWMNGQFSKEPHGDHLVISDNQFKAGASAHHAGSIEAADSVKTAVTTIKSDLEAACVDGSTTFLNIFKMDVAGIIFGQDGRTFPRP